MSATRKRRRNAAIAVVASLIASLALKQSVRTVAVERSPFESVASSLPSRPFEARLSGTFAYRPLRNSKQDSRGQLAASAIEALRAAETHPTAANLHTAGVAQLLLGNVARAKATLERASLVETGAADVEISIDRTRSAALLTDLTCAYLVSARAGRVSDLLRALPVAERAWQLDHTPATAWNRALACEALFLQREASAAWRDFQQIESDDAWKDEGLRHEHPFLAAAHRDPEWNQKQQIVAALRAGDRGALAELAHRHPAQLSGIGTEKLFDWAACAARSTDQAAAALRDARLIANALLPADTFLHDAVAAIDEAEARGDRTRTRRLLDGMCALARGRTLYGNRRFNDALSALTTATATLDSASSNLSLASRMIAASCLAYSQRYGEAAREIAPVTRDRRVHRYARLFGQGEWIGGLCSLALGKPYEALQSYSTAREVFARMDDRVSLAGLVDLEGEAYEHLGMAEKSWERRYAALSLHASAGDPNRSEAIFGGAARAAIKLGQYSAALHFVDAILPTKRDDAFALAELLVLRGAIRHSLGMMDAAAGDFRTARETLMRVPEGGAREALATDLRAVELLIGAGAGANGREASDAIAAARKENNKYRLVPLLRLRAASARDASRSAAAAESALAEMERQLATVRDQDIRLTSQHSLHDLYTSLIEASLNAGEIHRAAGLLDCERERSRLVNGAAVCGEFPLNDVPRGVALLDYAIMGEDLIVFSYRNGMLNARRMPAAARPIDARVRDFVDAVRNGEDARAKTVGARICTDLVDPFIADLDSATTIVIIGSPATVALPFAALWSGRTRRHLVEDWTIVHAPGVSRLVAAIRRDRILRDHARAGVDVAAFAPEYDPTVSPYLSPLPAARTEALAVRHSHPTGVCLIGPQATKTSFQKAGRSAETVHFAGHSITNDTQPRYAALALTRAAGQTPTMLYAYQIAALKWTSTRLVVLASCSSAAKTDSPSVVPVSLADAFLDAHVPAIVATVWPIDDGESMSLMLDLHRNLQAGRAAPAALRLAQIAALRSGDPRRSRLRYWAPYCFIGWHS